MKSWRIRLPLLAGAASLTLAIPALSQEAPVLPPGFGDPQAQPPAEEQPRTDTAPPDANAQTPSHPPPASIEAMPVEETELSEEEVLPPLPANLFLIPSERPTETVGLIGPGSGGLAQDAFGNANGAFLTGLMRRLDAPLPSRWASMLLRRALMSRVHGPGLVDPVDWVAERSALLLRMGEADAARLLVHSVDVPLYTPRMIAVARDTALANADVGGLCPLVAPGRRVADEPIWNLAEAMCAGLEGDAARAGMLIDQARRRGQASGIDLVLAEKVVGAGIDSRRAVTVQWDEVQTINPWRFGLASATGLTIPQNLVANAAPDIRAWLARAPMVPIEDRIGAAGHAAVLGVFSSASLNDIHALVMDSGADGENGPAETARHLRAAWIGRTYGERMQALRRLWDVEAPAERYARLILTAGAAARIAPSEAHAADADDLVASMLAAGMDRQAARWAGFLGTDAAGNRAWAMLAVGGPQGAVALDSGRLQTLINADDSEGKQRARLLLAALAGLGRLSTDEAASLGSGIGLDLARADRWSAAIDAAAARRQPGTVALVAGVGMQTGSWSGVPADYLFRIVRALAAVGLEYEARMIAAEAMARL